MAEAGTDDSTGDLPGRAAPELPTTFGKYYLTEKLATGGMAEIYLAKIIGPGGFEKPLVIKQIHPKLSGQRHFVDLFVAEAKTLVTLTHGNIVPVYELGVVDDTYFIAMEYIDGPTLYRLTETMSRRDGKMEPALAAWITARIVEGLDYAHRKGEGVIHRDLSPRNVMLSRDGDVKLVDFGIAVTLGEPGEGEGSQSSPGAGQSPSPSTPGPTGSFPYMSPEQVRRESLSPQTDLFSVGVLFWEMLVGERLFARADADATLDAVLREAIPRPSSRRPEVPAKLDELVMRALERGQDARWPNAGEMLAALQRYLYSLDETPTPRDVAALVARFCPPETRRLPTHLEALAHDVLEPVGDAPSGPATQVGAEAEVAPPAGPRTAVIPRDGSAPRGKRSQRHKTFATHVDLKNMLEGAPPSDASDANGASSAAATTDEPTPPPPTTQVTPRVVTNRPARLASIKDPIEDEPALPVLGHAPPSRGVLIVVGIGGVALAIAAIFVFFNGRAAVLRADALRSDSHAIAMATPDAAAAPPDATVADAAPPDAGRRESRDAAVLARPDAIIRMTVDAGVLEPRPDAAARGTATLKIGADPWGAIYIDGVHEDKWMAPREIAVSAGHHVIEIRNTTDTKPQTFAVDLGAGETKAIQADFTH